MDTWKAFAVIRPLWIRCFVFIRCYWKSQMLHSLQLMRPLFLLVLTVNYVIQDGKSNWLKGFILICLYSNTLSRSRHWPYLLLNSLVCYSDGDFLVLSWCAVTSLPSYYALTYLCQLWILLVLSLNVAFKLRYTSYHWFFRLHILISSR